MDPGVPPPAPARPPRPDFAATGERNARIACFGHHKCASTFVLRVVADLARAHGLVCRMEFLSRRLPLGYEAHPDHGARVERAYQAIRQGDFDLLCHGNADRDVVAALAASGPIRAIHVIRDPRDLLVSGFFWHMSPASQANAAANPWAGDRHRRLRARPDKESALLQDLDFAECYFAALREWDYGRDDILELRYEDMVADVPGFFRRSAAFLGLTRLPPDEFDAIVERHGYARQTGGRPPGVEAADHKYRKGMAGDWRNHFTPRLTAAFKERHGDLLTKLGYETGHDWSADPAGSVRT